METYARYKDARNTAWETLISLNLVQFPLSVSKICKTLGVRLCIGDSLPNNKEAMAEIINNEPIIYYKQIDYIPHLRFVITHELGHIVLKHFNSSIIRDSFTEAEANAFARDLLMPAIVCHLENLNTVEKIATFFNTSPTSAKIRLERLVLLEKRNAWYLSPLERLFALRYKQRP